MRKNRLRKRVDIALGMAAVTTIALISLPGFDPYDGTEKGTEEDLQLLRATFDLARLPGSFTIDGVVREQGQRLADGSWTEPVAYYLASVSRADFEDIKPRLEGFNGSGDGQPGSGADSEAFDGGLVRFFSQRLSLETGTRVKNLSHYAVKRSSIYASFPFYPAGSLIAVYGGEESDVRLFISVEWHESG